jgi:endonuclease IV
MRKPAYRGDAEELRASAVPLYVHAPYLVNVCSPRNNVRYGSRKILQQACDAAATVGAAAVVVHPGRDPPGTGADRHANLGKRTMGTDVLPFGRTVQNPQIARETRRSMRACAQ